MTCDIGDSVELRVVFKHRKSGEPFQPDKVICTVLQPDGETLTPAAEPEDGDEAEEGAYVATVTPKASGEWRFSFDGYDSDDEPVGSEEGRFSVRKRRVPRD